jgi:molybdenum cofactor cytidylyltransferase
MLSELGIERGDVISVVGAGGKTTLCYRIADAARAAGWTALVTSTTHMGTLAEDVTGRVFVESDGPVDVDLDEALASTRRATLLGRRVREDKLSGVSASRVDELVGRADLLVVEADGARGRSLKAPADHEPVLPSSTRLLLVVAGLDVIGRPLDDTAVHRLAQIRTALALGSSGVRSQDADWGPADLTPQAVAQVLSWPQGYPAHRGSARLVAFLNKEEDPRAEAAAAVIARELVPVYDRVLAGSARSGHVRVLAVGTQSSGRGLIG